MKVAISNDPSHYNLNQHYRLRFNRKYLFLGFILVIFSFYCGVLFYKSYLKLDVWEWAIEKGHNALGENDLSIRDKIIKVPELLLGANYDFPRLNIDINFKRFKKLESKRAEALLRGILVQGEDDFVPAKIRFGGRTTKVKLRLKGDWVDHLAGNKWSFRIHTKGKSQLFSMRRFSIQNPDTRGFQGEILFHETLSPFNIIRPRYFFVNVVINGEDIGVMALEEHFSKELLEHNGRKEGVIVRFDETLFWDSRKDVKNKEIDFSGPFESYLNADLDAFGSSKVKKSERLSKEYQVAVGLLRGFTRGQLAVSEVFDVEQMGSYIAVSQFWGAWHALRWHNLRFYLNPLTMKLEPIAFDANLQDRREPGEDITVEPIIKSMLQDVNLKTAFNKTLKQLNMEAVNGELARRLQVKEKPVLDILHTEYFFLEGFNYAELLKRASTKYKVRLNINEFPIFVHAYLVTDNEINYLELSNPLPYTVEVRNIFWKDKAGNTQAFAPDQVVKYPFKLTPTKVDELPLNKEISYKPLTTSSKMSLYVESRIVGQEEIRQLIAQRNYPALSASPLPAVDRKQMLEKNGFIDWQPDSSTIHVKPGSWQVNGSIVIPKGYQLEIPAGTTLQFQPGAWLVSYGGTRFSGTEDAPIIMEGIATSDGQPATWQGVVVHQAQKKSEWDFVHVRYTTGINLPLWSLTGGTTFYQSDVVLRNCIFSDNQGEDALNIVHAKFDLQNVNIIGAVSDGFDGDFVTGSIRDGLFQDIGLAGGGDGIDFSGSEVVVEGTHFVRINDKAISVGEGSALKARGIVAEDIGVGAASKDNSNLILKDSNIRNAHVAGLMSYVKKAEYGASLLMADNLEITDTKRQALVQTGSQLSLNGQIVQSEDLDIDKLYKTIMKPGLR